MAIDPGAIVTELSARGYTAYEGTVEEYLNSNASAASIVCVNEVDADFDVCDNVADLEGTYTIEFQIWCNGAGASASARALRESVIGWIISTGLYVFEMTGWERVEEEAIGTARFHIATNIYQTRGV